MRVGNSVVLSIHLFGGKYAPESFLSVEIYAGRRHQKSSSNAWEAMRMVGLSL